MNGMRYSKQSVENTRTIDGLDWLNTARVVAEISCLFTFSSVAVEQWWLLNTQTKRIHMYCIYVLNYTVWRWACLYLYHPLESKQMQNHLSTGILSGDCFFVCLFCLHLLCARRCRVYLFSTGSSNISIIIAHPPTWRYCQLQFNAVKS